MPGGEHRQFDGQLNDDYSIEVFVYRKSHIISSNSQLPALQKERIVYNGPALLF